jgi:hypothetical protein
LGELEAMKERVRAGNDKLMAAWPRIWDIADENERKRRLGRWDKASTLLHVLCGELKYRFNYRDCLYMESGKKTKPCVRSDGSGCLVCPSETPYWRGEEEGPKGGL